MKNNVWGVKVYTKTVTEGGNREMWGVIEAPIHKMLKAFPDEFKFMKHETRRSLDGKRSVRSKTTRQHSQIAKLQKIFV